MSEQGGDEGVGVWVNPREVFNRVLMLSGTAVMFANPNEEKLGEAMAAMERGEESGAAALGKVKGLPLADLRRVECNLRGRDVKFRRGSGKASESKSFEAASDEQRDEILRSVGERLGAGWVRRDAQYGVVRASLSPVVTLVVLGGITTALWLGARDLASGGEVDTGGRRGLLKRVFVWLLELLGPTGVLIVGGLICVVVLVWLVGRVRNPPLMAVIKRG